MSSPISAQATGTFTSDGTAVSISIPSEYTEIELLNLDDLGSAAANTNVMIAKGSSSMPAGAALYWPKTSGAATLGTPVHVASNGFTFVSDSGSQAPSAAVAISGITNAAPPVVSTASTAGLANTDIVRVYNTTGQLNIAGMDFTIGSLIANTSFELSYMGAPGAAATAGSWIRIPFDARYYPRRRFITAITAANPMVVTMSVTHGLTVGQSVRLVVPAAFGMTQADGLLGEITAISTANNTITLDIDSSAFTAFAFPTSAVAAAGVNFAQVVPVGSAGSLLDDATDNQSIRGVTIGTSVQTSGVEYQWIAKKGTSI